MSRRPMIAPYPVINMATATSSITSNPTIINQLPGLSYDVAWTGTVTGTLKVQVSNSVKLDAQGNVLSAGNWNDLPSTAYMDTLPAPAGSAGHGFINVNPNVQAYAARLVFTASGGTGLLTAIVCSKVQ